MKAYQISRRAWALHADARTDDLFEGIWPIPDGVSLNSYLVRGKKTALIDLVRDWADAPSALLDGLASIGVKPADIDYLVLNHLEPDHTGWLAEFRAMAPKAEIIATAKGRALVKNFYKIEEGVRPSSPGDTLDLGEGECWPSRTSPTCIGPRPWSPSEPRTAPSSPATPSAPSASWATGSSTTSSAPRSTPSSSGEPALLRQHRLLLLHLREARHPEAGRPRHQGRRAQPRHRLARGTPRRSSTATRATPPT